MQDFLKLYLDLTYDELVLCCKDKQPKYTDNTSPVWMSSDTELDKKHIELYNQRAASYLSDFEQRLPDIIKADKLSGLYDVMCANMGHETDEDYIYYKRSKAAETIMADYYELKFKALYQVMSKHLIEQEGIIRLEKESLRLNSETTKLSKISITNIHRILNFGIKDTKDMYRMMHTNNAYADVIRNHSSDIWLRLMTYDNLVSALANDWYFFVNTIINSDDIKKFIDTELDTLEKRLVMFKYASTITMATALVEMLLHATVIFDGITPVDSHRDESIKSLAFAGAVLGKHQEVIRFWARMNIDMKSIQCHLEDFNTIDGEDIEGLYIALNMDCDIAFEFDRDSFDLCPLPANEPDRSKHIEFRLITPYCHIDEIEFMLLLEGDKPVYGLWNGVCIGNYSVDPIFERKVLKKLLMNVGVHKKDNINSSCRFSNFLEVVTRLGLYDIIDDMDKLLYESYVLIHIHDTIQDVHYPKELRDKVRQALLNIINNEGQAIPIYITNDDFFDMVMHRRLIPSPPLKSYGLYSYPQLVKAMNVNPERAVMFYKHINITLDMVQFMYALTIPDGDDVKYDSRKSNIDNCHRDLNAIIARYNRCGKKELMNFERSDQDNFYKGLLGDLLNDCNCLRSDYSDETNYDYDTYDKNNIDYNGKSACQSMFIYADHVMRQTNTTLVIIDFIRNVFNIEHHKYCYMNHILHMLLIWFYIHYGVHHIRETIEELYKAKLDGMAILEYRITILKAYIEHNAPLLIWLNGTEYGKIFLFSLMFVKLKEMFIESDKDYIRQHVEWIAALANQKSILYDMIKDKVPKPDPGYELPDNVRALLPRRDNVSLRYDLKQKYNL